MNDRVTVLENDKISLWCYPKKGLIHHEMHKPTWGHTLHEALDKGIDAMRRCRGSKWLSDDRQNGALPPSDLEWAETVWFPKTVAAGWKFWAVVQPEKVVGQMNIRRHIKMYAERGVTTQVFTDPKAAMAWLDSLER